MSDEVGTGPGAPVAGSGAPVAGSGAPGAGSGAPAAGSGGPVAGSGAPAALSPQGWAETFDGVVLVGVECGSCGAVRVPYHGYGCEVCGATGSTLRRVELPAVGRLRDTVSVFRHPTRTVPFTLGEIELDAGPVVLALLSEAEGWPFGSIVEAATTTPDEHRLPVFSLKRTP